MALWVFGYGSLLWDPGFEPAETRRAVLTDYHRSFCMLSIHHRGTEANPGLVLALDRQAGATCTGLALRPQPEDEDRVLAALRERELISSAYVECEVDLTCAGGEALRALAYVVDRDHRQYVRFDLETQAQMIAGAVGGRGPNPDYLFRTADLLARMNIRDPEMEELTGRVKALLQ